MRKRDASPLKLMASCVKGLGYLGLCLVFSGLAVGALRLFLTTRFTPALVASALLLGLIVTLTLRNQARYNSVLDCLYWDRPTVLLLFVAIIATAALIWRSEVALRAQRRSAYEQGGVAKSSLSRIQIDTKQLRVDLSSLRQVSQEVEDVLGTQALGDLRNLDIEASQKTIEDARRKASLIVDRVASGQKRLFDLGVPPVVWEYDQAVAREVDSNKSRLLLEVASQYKEAFALERRLAAQSEDVAALVEIVDRDLSLRNVDLRIQELSTKKQHLRDEGARLLEVELPQYAPGAMQILLSSLAAEGKLLRSSAELATQYRDLDSYSGWRPITDQRSHQSPSRTRLLGELAQRRNDLTGILMLQHDLSDLSSVSGKVEAHIGGLLREFSLRPDVKGEVNRLIQQQAGLAKKMLSLEELRESLSGILFAFREYKKYEHDDGYLISEFKRVQSGDLKALSSVLEAQKSSIGDFDLAYYYFVAGADSAGSAKIDRFANEFGDILRELDALRIILGSDLVTRLPAGDSLRQRFSEIDAQAKDLQADFVDLSEYARRKDRIRDDSQKRLQGVKEGAEKFLIRAGKIYGELDNDSKVLTTQIESQLLEADNLQRNAEAMYFKAQKLEEKPFVELVFNVRDSLDYLQARNPEDLSLRVDALASQIEVIRQRVQRGKSGAQDGIYFVARWREIDSKIAWIDESLASVQVANSRRLSLGEFEGRFHEMENGFAGHILALHTLEERIGSGDLKAYCYAAAELHKAARMRLITSYTLVATFIVALVWILLTGLSRKLAHNRILKEEEAARGAEGGGAEPLLKIVRSKTKPSHLREFAAKRLAAFPRRDWEDSAVVEGLIHELESEPSRIAQKLIGILNDVALNIKRQMAREI